MTGFILVFLGLYFLASVYLNIVLPEMGKQAVIKSCETSLSVDQWDQIIGYVWISSENVYAKVKSKIVKNIIAIAILKIFIVNQKLY